MFFGFYICDLYILGTGKKGGMLSVFLMGCFDEKNKLWKTVTKVSGFDDKTMKELQVFLFIFGNLWKFFIKFEKLICRQT